MQQYTQEKQNNYVNKDKEKRRVFILICMK